MTKAELSSVKSFSGTRSPSIDVRASDRDDSGAQRLNRVDERFKASADRACDRV
jgi:hypothetical protein